MKIKMELNLTEDIFEKALDIYVDDWQHDIYELTPSYALRAVLQAYFHQDDDNFTDAIIRTLSNEAKESILDGFGLAYRLHATKTIFENLELD